MLYTGKVLKKNKNKYSKAVLVALVLLAATSELGFAITNTGATTILPSVVSISNSAAGNHNCSASVLTRTWLITAAHCFLPNDNLNNFRVYWASRIGSRDLIFDGKQ